ncbi:aminoacyl-tRNA hydrolase [Mycoplasmoides genitalium]
MPTYKLIVGLGNLGKEYEKTRHNAGFMVLDRLASLFHLNFDKTNKLGDYLFIKEKAAILAKPATFMNNSGLFVKWLQDHFQIPLANIMIVHDEIAFDLGVIRLKMQGSANNHNGIKSVIRHLDTEQFNRLRFGIKSQNTSNILHEQVMSEFQNSELTKLEVAITKSVELLKRYIEGEELQRLMEYYHHG